MNTYIKIFRSENNQEEELEKKVNSWLNTHHYIHVLKMAQTENDWCTHLIILYESKVLIKKEKE